MLKTVINPPYKLYSILFCSVPYLIAFLRSNDICTVHFAVLYSVRIQYIRYRAYALQYRINGIYTTLGHGWLGQGLLSPWLGVPYYPYSKPERNYRSGLVIKPTSWCFYWWNHSLVEGPLHILFYIFYSSFYYLFVCSCGEISKAWNWTDYIESLTNDWDLPIYMNSVIVRTVSRESLWILFATLLRTFSIQKKVFGTYCAASLSIFFILYTGAKCHYQDTGKGKVFKIF